MVHESEALNCHVISTVFLAGKGLTCEILETVHLFEQMEARGIAPDEIRRAVHMGSKEWKAEDQYVGKYGVCSVKVRTEPCTLYVITAWIG